MSKLLTIVLLSASMLLFAINLTAQLSGNYEINSDGTGDYLSFTAAINDLTTQGVNGPVIFNVAPGIYTEQLEIGTITGASLINRITFIGSDDVEDTILTFSPTNENQPHLIRLNGAKYITFDNLTFEIGTNALYGYIFFIQNLSEHIEIINSVLNNKIATTSSFVSIVASATSNWSGGGNNIHHILIQGNDLNDGFAGIRLNGGPGIDIQGIEIRDNFLNNMYNTGIYLDRVFGSIVDNNLIDNRTEAPVTPLGTGIHLMQAFGPTQISNNVIRNVGRYGIYSIHGSGDPNNRGRIFNNSIGGGFLAPGAFTSGIRFGTGTTNWEIHYNSVNLDFGEGAAYLHDVTPFTGVMDVRNNSFAYTGGSSGYAIRLWAPQLYHTIDNNNYYSNGPHLALYYNDMFFTDLAEMQDSNLPPGSNMNSLEGDPTYTSIYNLQPTGLQLYAAATPIPGIPEDILGNPRDDDNPSIGAYEITLADNPFLAVNPANLHFIGTLSSISTELLTLYNVGSDVVTIDEGDIYFTGPDSADFTLQYVTYPINIATDEEAQIQLNFQPATEGDKEATLVIEHSGYNSPFYYPVTGFAYPSNVAIIGSGTTVNPNYSGNPINIIYRSLRGQMVYHAADLYAAGIEPGATLTHFGFYVHGAPLEPLPNFRIRMDHTSAEDSSAHINITSERNVYTNPSYMPVEGGWDILPLSTPFIWNGVDNILVDTAFAQVGEYHNSGQTRIYMVENGFRFIRGDEQDQSEAMTALTSNYKPQAFMQFTSPPDPGTISGNVTLLGGNASVTDVNVNVGHINVNPDINGDFTIQIYPGTFDVTASLPGYQTDVFEGVVVISNGFVTGIDLTLSSIEIDVTPLSITENVDFQSGTTVPLTISNIGYAPLEYSITTVFQTDERRSSANLRPSFSGFDTIRDIDPMDMELSPLNESFDISDLDFSRDLFDLHYYFPVQGGGEYGISTDGNYIYGTRWNSSIIYRYELDGTFVNQFSINGVANLREITYDGVYFYGSPNSNIIYIMDFTNETLVGQIQTTVTSIRNITYDANNDKFWVTNGWTAPFLLVDRSGQIVQTLPSAMANISGIAWDGVSGEEPFIWAYSQPEGIGNILTQINMSDGALVQSFDLGDLGIFNPSASGGLEITDQLVHGKWTFLGMAQNDIAWVVELTDSIIHWLTVDSTSGVIPAGDDLILQVNLNAAGLPSDTYNAELIISNNSLNDTIIVPAQMIVEDGDPVIGIEPTSLDFGQQQVGLLSEPELITITNIGGGILSLEPEDIVVSGDDADEFVLENITEGIDLGYDESVSISLHFSPASEGIKSAVLLINDNLNSAATRVTLSRTNSANSADRSREIHEVELTGEGVYFLLPPGNLIAQVGDSFVGLSWDAPFVPSGNRTRANESLLTRRDNSSRDNVRIVLEGYNVYRDYVLLNTELITETHYTDTEVTNGVTYQYYVTAVYDEGESGPSNTVEATPNEQLDFLIPPQNLTATLISSSTVQLDWEAPEFGDWIYWDSGINEGNSIGTGGVVQFSVAQRFSPANLQDLNAGGRYLTEIRFFPVEANAFYTVKVWTGGSSAAPGSLILSQEVTSPVIGEWNYVNLSTPVFIDDSQELWFGYHVNAFAGYPAGADNGPAVDGFGNMMYFDGVWSTLLEIDSGLNYNWNVHGYTANVAGRELTQLSPPAAQDQIRSEKVNTDIEFSLFRFTDTINNPLTRERDLQVTAYRVYRNDNMIAEVTPDQTTYIDEVSQTGSYLYHVTALYDTEESGQSNTVIVNILSVDDELEMVTTGLKGNYPNPFNPETTIRFSLAEAGRVNLDIYNIRGQKIATLVDDHLEAGNHSVTWNGRTDTDKVAGSGVYFYRMQKGSYSETRKMILMK